jgi:hypothetical protein
MTGSNLAFGRQFDSTLVLEQHDIASGSLLTRSEAADPLLREQLTVRSLREGLSQAQTNACRDPFIASALNSDYYLYSYELNRETNSLTLKFTDSHSLDKITKRELSCIMIDATNNTTINFCLCSEQKVGELLVGEVRPAREVSFNNGFFILG